MAPCVRAEELKAQKGVTGFLVAPLPFRVAPPQSHHCLDDQGLQECEIFPGEKGRFGAAHPPPQQLWHPQVGVPMGVHLTAEEDGPKPKAQGSARRARGSYGVQFNCCVGLVQRRSQVGGIGEATSTQERGSPWGLYGGWEWLGSMLSGSGAAGAGGCLLGELPCVASLIYCLFKQWG